VLVCAIYPYTLADARKHGKEIDPLNQNVNGWSRWQTTDDRCEMLLVSRSWDPILKLTMILMPKLCVGGP
jgi:hypothetical protein